jgi:2'-5' RNA ligase
LITNGYRASPAHHAMPRATWRIATVIRGHAPRMPRIFAAIEIPSDVQDALEALRAPLPGARWIDPGNYHVTLRFAGDLDNGTAREFDAGLAAAGGKAFPLRLKGLGAFGGSSPSSVWAGVEPSCEFDALMRAVERAARGAGLAPAKLSAKPHVTLARLRRSDSAAVARFLERRAAFRSRVFLVDRFVLMSAKPFTGGGPYVVEACYPLGRTAPDYPDRP